MEEGSIKLQYFDDDGEPGWEIEFDSWQVIFDKYNSQVRINLCGANVIELSGVCPNLNEPKR